MKILKRLRKLVAVVIAALIINITVLSPALPVQASETGEGVETTVALLPLYQYFLEIFGIAYGLGASYEGWENASDLFAELQAQWSTSGTIEVDGYDLTDRDEALAYLDSVIYKYNGHVENTSPNSTLLALDAKSYAATGSLISLTTSSLLQEYKNYVNGTSAEEFEDDVRSTFTVINGNGDSDGDGNDDEFDYSTAQLLFGVLLAGLATEAADLADQWFAPVSNSAYSWNELSSVDLVVNGVSVPCYLVTNYNVMDTNAKGYKYYFDTPVYITPYKQNSSDGGFYVFSPTLFSGRYDFYRDNAIESTGSFGTPLYEESKGLYQSNKRHTCHFYPLGYFDYDAVSKSSIMTALSSQIYDFNYTAGSAAIGASVLNGLSSYNGRNVTAANVGALASALSVEAGLSTGTDSAVGGIAAAITGALAGLPSNPNPDAPGSDITDSDAVGLLGSIASLIAGLKTDIADFPALLQDIADSILTVPDSITDDLADILQDIADDTSQLVESALENGQGTDGYDPDNPDKNHSIDFLDFINGLIILVLILLELLKIFFHCLQFIMVIFKIPSSTAFLPEEMVLGIDYIKSLQIPGIGMSVYSFMMGLVYILIVFYAIRILRINVDRIKMPRR